MTPEYLWMIPAFPLLAAAFTAFLPRNHKRLSSQVAITALAASLLVSFLYFIGLLSLWSKGEPLVHFYNFEWFQVGDSWVRLGWLIDPLTSVMLVMICTVSLLVFIYSQGYMREDANFTRFFCFLSFFAAAMLGLVLANSLLLLFICWELVGLASYLLIGFWFQRPAAAAAAKKAFITTRLGDLALLLGLVWLYGECGSVLFYDNGAGCLEPQALASLGSSLTRWGMLTSTAIGLLLLAGAAGKSGQVPLHVWLPDAMEGPTPVSALIHAATMVAAGVFLMARVYPLLAAAPGGSISTALQTLTWIGAVTAVIAASIAVAQTDIKRILAYSTVSQLGFMMLGLGTGGVAVGMFHLITHAFFKALLFLGAGSVIHGMHEEQDIRRMGGLRRSMPWTFATYAVGMLALSGFPLVFSGFWSKDAILHGAHGWAASSLPFYLGLVAALLTAFYMARQVCYVFFGEPRGKPSSVHESPSVMLVPLILLALFAVLLGFLGTPMWPWIQAFLSGVPTAVANHGVAGAIPLLLLSSVIALGGLWLGGSMYRRPPGPGEPDPLERRRPDLYHLFRRKYYFDEVYQWAVVGTNAAWARACARLDDLLAGAVALIGAYAAVGFGWLGRVTDEYVVNLGFDQVCRGLRWAGTWLALRHQGKVQVYLRVIGAAAALLILALLWGCTRQ